MALDIRIKNELVNTYKVPDIRCDDYDQIYNETILPRIQEKFLAHFVSVVEDMIFEKILENDPKARRFRIILWKNNPKNGKAAMRTYRYGAIISYNPHNSYQDLRIFIAHELGHLLCRYQIIAGGVTENNANLFAYFAINGKNTFYKFKAPTLIYTGGELQIISSIQSVCPITRVDQF